MVRGFGRGLSMKWLWYALQVAVFGAVMWSAHYYGWGEGGSKVAIAAVALVAAAGAPGAFMVASERQNSRTANPSR